MSISHISVIKIGGNVIDNPAALERFVIDFAAVAGPKILVHGGGKEATRLSRALGVETQMVDGRRITDRQTLDIVAMVYAGLINKRIVAALQAAGCNAIGLSGADGNVIRATLRRPEPIDYGFVGDISPDNVDTQLISSLLQQGLTPVFCAIMHDGHGSLLNCNADSVASAVAIASSRLAKTDLTFCFEMPGVLMDVNDPQSVIARLDEDSIARLTTSGVISAGMRPKIANALAAVKAGVNSVIIKQADSLLTPSGTTIAL